MNKACYQCRCCAWFFNDHCPGLRAWSLESCKELTRTINRAIQIETESPYLYKQTRRVSHNDYIINNLVEKKKL